VKLGGMRDATMKRNEIVKQQADQRAESWRGIVQLMHEAGSSLREIAEALNSAGVKTARGGNWHPISVARVLDRLQA
jgi:hypothetical protein